MKIIINSLKKRMLENIDLYFNIAWINIQVLIPLSLKFIHVSMRNTLFNHNDQKVLTF